jgi:hypothetical protein
MSDVVYHISNHAREEMARRKIPADIVELVMAAPQQIIDTHNERKVYQSKMTIDGKLYLVRIIVELSDPLTIVTAYRTSKIDKYWRDDHESNL